MTTKTGAGTLSWRWTSLYAAGAVAAFHLAYGWPALSVLTVAYLAGLFQLARARTGRQAFYTGLAVGLLTVGPQLKCFQVIFGPAAIVLWLIIALWIGLFAALVRLCLVRLGPLRTALLAPFLWTGFKCFPQRVVLSEVFLAQCRLCFFRKPAAAIVWYPRNVWDWFSRHGHCGGAFAPASTPRRFDGPGAGSDRGGNAAPENASCPSRHDRCPGQERAGGRRATGISIPRRRNYRPGPAPGRVARGGIAGFERIHVPGCRAEQRQTMVPRPSPPPYCRRRRPGVERELLQHRLCD